MNPGTNLANSITCCITVVSLSAQSSHQSRRFWNSCIIHIWLLYFGVFIVLFSFPIVVLGELHSGRCQKWGKKPSIIVILSHSTSLHFALFSLLSSSLYSNLHSFKVETLKANLNGTGGVKRPHSTGSFEVNSRFVRLWIGRKERRKNQSDKSPGAHILTLRCIFASIN